MDIELRQIHKRFGPIHANNDINVKFHHGRIVGILGENGAGKSTLMKILSGFQPADQGEILIDDQIIDYTGPTAAIANGIGMLQQDPLDVGAFTVLENFIYGGAEGITLQRAQAEAQLQDLTTRFGFELDPHQPIDNLLIAQRQQLEIIRLLALGVETLILDEPTTGISAEQKDILFDALRKLARDEGMIILLVSHKLEDVIDLCDEVVVLRAGLMVGDMDMPDSDKNLTGAVIAETKQQLVTLMFGEELEAQNRPHYELGRPVLDCRQARRARSATGYAADFSDCSQWRGDRAGGTGRQRTRAFHARLRPSATHQWRDATLRRQQHYWRALPSTIPARLRLRRCGQTGRRLDRRLDPDRAHRPRHRRQASRSIGSRCKNER